MRENILCDRCKREFSSAEEAVNDLGEVICPDCYDDTAIEKHTCTEDIYGHCYECGRNMLE